MLREHIFSSRTPTDSHFRWRGGDVSRIEGLSDAAFAFAMTMLLVDSFRSLNTSGELIANMLEIPSLMACFAVLMWIWATHYQFFRRYGLEDGYTIFLNAVLLFAVMVYVYPLKFVSDFVINVLVFRRLPLDAAGEPFMPVAREHALWMMVIYGAGFTLIFLLFGLMVRHAYHQRQSLELDELELFITRSSGHVHLLSVSVGLLSIALASLGLVLGRGSMAAAAGLVYFLNGPLHWWHGARVDRGTKAILRRLEGSSA